MMTDTELAVTDTRTEIFFVGPDLGIGSGCASFLAGLWRNFGLAI
jgi:hypothetical protein